MKSKLFLVLSLTFLISCQQRFSASSITSTTSNNTITVSGSNVLVVQIGNCGADGYTNEPCATVTVCVPGTTSCQTISNILVDTGSYGLRIFSQALTLSLPHVTDSAGHPIAECAYFGSANDWGPVETADVQMNGETASSIAIQVVDSTFGKYPSTTCTSPEASPSVAGYNGILGVGLFKEDCGDGCESATEYSSYKVYYSCASSSSTAACTNIPLALSGQVSNPVAFFNTDNNGVILELPAISSSGATLVTGALIFGIGTNSNNSPSTTKTFLANDYGEFTTSFNESPYSNGFTGGTESFIDSGSNGLFFPSTGISQCSDAEGFYCPTSTLNLTATQESYNGSVVNALSFQILSADTAFASSNTNWAYNNIGGYISAGFDWGLPFFFGKSIVVGIEATASTLGTGPYWAY